MRRFRRISYIVLIAIIAILSFTVYTNVNKENPNEQKEKTFSEIEYVESKLEDLLNTMNNIDAKNYTLEVGDLSKEAIEKSNEESSASQSSGGEGGSSSSNSGSSSGGDTSSGDSATGTEDKEDQKKFDMKLSGVLTNSKDINWDYVKNEIELIYTSIPTMTLDWYQLDINKEDILKFNQEFDKLAIVVKNENKEETLSELTKLYEYLPKFLEHATDDNVYKTVANTKTNIFKGYSKLDSGNWDEIGNDIKNATETYTKLLTDTSVQANQQYSVSKGYIMLNELQNAVSSKDESVFLIKYKNLIEEIDNL